MKIKNNYLVKQKIPVTTTFTSKVEATNRIALLDRSGSMSWEIRQVIDDLCERLDSFSEEDFFTCGWFSSQNQFGWICKGMSLSNKPQIKEMLQRYKSTVGMTCFSDILADTKNVIQDLSGFSKNFALLMFTDGEPVVSNYNAEVTKIKSELKALSTNLSSSVFIGYGEYYNRELMSDMARNAGGILVHSSNLTQLSKYIVEFAENKSESNKVEINVPVSTLRNVVFTVEGKNVVTYDVENGKVFLPQNVTEFYYLTSNKSDSDVDENIAYAAARVYSQLGDVATAIDLMASVGDVNFIDGLNNAFTNAEYGSVETLLGHAVTDKNFRYLKGKNKKYAPDDNAFCVLDLLELLQENEAKFLPFSENFVYNKVSRGSSVKEGYAKLEMDKTQEVEMNAFTWNKTTLNLSILAYLKGTVNLGEEAKQHGLAEVFPTHTYRNYTIIKDGKLNVKKLPVKVPSGVLKNLPDNVISAEFANGEVVLNLEVLPVINRNIAQKYLSAGTLAEKVLREKELEAYQKYVKYQLDLLTEDKPKATEFLSEAQVEFLESKGITKNGYAPPKEMNEVTDSYFTKEFEVSVDGLKSIPKISDFITKYLNNKVDTKKLVEKYLLDIHTEFNKVSSSLKEKAIITWLENKLSDIKTELKDIRKYTQKAKFAVLLAKQNFTEIPKLSDKTVFNHNGTDFTFSLKEKEVKI